MKLSKSVKWLLVGLCGVSLLGVAGVWAARTWYARHGLGRTAALAALYVGAMGASHPLAKRIGRLSLRRRFGCMFGLTG